LFCERRRAAGKPNVRRGAFGSFLRRSGNKMPIFFCRFETKITGIAAGSNSLSSGKKPNGLSV
jgi:hypothetical protein